MVGLVGHSYPNIAEPHAAVGDPILAEFSQACPPAPDHGFGLPQLSPPHQGLVGHLSGSNVADARPM
jgi:hypothetical protein